MRVTYHDNLSPGASRAAQLECKKGQNGQTLGGRRALDRENGKSGGLASSCIIVRVVSVCEWYVDWSAPMRLCGIRDALHESAFDRGSRSQPARMADAGYTIRCCGLYWCWVGYSAVIDLCGSGASDENVTFSTKLWQ